MKKLTLLFLFQVSSLILFSQDLIVREDGDSVNCKITKIYEGKIFFSVQQDGKFRSTFLPLSKVKEHRVAYYKEKEEEAMDLIAKNFKYPKLRIALHGGFGYRIAPLSDDISDDLEDYMNELKSGVQFSADLTYFWGENYGFGIKYSHFIASNHRDDVYVKDDQGNRRYGVLSDDISIIFLGPSFTARVFNKAKTNAFIFNLSYGYVGYFNDQVIVDKYKQSGATFGSFFDIGYDLGLSRHVALGVQLSYSAGLLNKLKIDDGNTVKTLELEEGEYESLARLGLSVGLRIRI